MSENKISENKSSRYSSMAIRYLHRYFFVLAGLMAVVMLVLGYRMIIKPKYNTITKELQKTIESRIESKDLMNRYLQRLDEYVQNYNAIPRETRNKLNRVFISDYDPEIIFSLMEEVARKQGVVLLSQEMRSGEDRAGAASAKGADDKTPGGIQKIEFSANFSGLDYQSFKSLLRALEESAPLFDIRSVNFDPSSRNVSLEMTAYYLP